MKVEVKGYDDDGEVLFEGKLNKQELSFLLNYSINDLIAAGAMFNLDEPDEDDDNPAMRIKWPEGSLN